MLPAITAGRAMTQQPKIRIWDAVREAYVGAYRNFGMYLKIAWPYFGFALINRHWFARLDSSEVEKALGKEVARFHYWLYYDMSFVWHGLYEVFAAIVIVGFYRYLLLGKTDDLHVFKMKRGILEPKTFLKFPPVYFRFKWRREALVFALLLFMDELRRFAQRLFGMYTEAVRHSFYPDSMPAEAIMPVSAIFAYFNYIWLGLCFLFGASVVLLWPYISTAKRGSFADARRALNATQGNVLRIFAVMCLISLPILLPEAIVLPVLFFADETFEQLFMREALGTLAFVRDVMTYIVLAAQVYFAQSLYRKFLSEDQACAETAA